MYRLLDTLSLPEDLKKLSIDQLNGLSEEIRSFLIDSVSKTGGHLASNLGVVELTVAMHTVFDMPKDKVVWDVGHQSYVHKILTGRMDRFSTLRQFGGMSGFPKRNESEYDCFDTGHSSTSISAALGIAKARDLSGGQYNVLSVFGDGALTGGMMYEAINHVGRSKTKVILILNDNAMSISKNVGAISNYLRNLRAKPTYYKSKQIVENALNRFPVCGKSMARFIRASKRYIRRMVIPTTLFDDLGLEYIGPIDGHDMKSLLSVMERAKTSKKSVIIHVNTKKGKGYALAENNPQVFHGVSKFDVSAGIDTLTKSGKDYSAAFGGILCSIAEKNDKVVAITGAMPLGTGLSVFSARFKNRFFDVGIAEQHAVTFAAGLAVSGYIPVIPIYSSFLQRAYDQTLHDVCLQNVHVVFAIDRAGIVGADGETHQGVYDIAYLSHMPNMTILSPCNFIELGQMLDYAVNIHKGPIAVRYPRGGLQADIPTIPFQPGKGQLVQEGTDVSIITAGRMVCTAQKAASILEKNGITADILSLRTIKPLDNEAIIASARKTGVVVTVEDGTLIGGIGSLAAAVLKEADIACRFHRFAFPDMPIVHGSIDELDRSYHIDAESIADYIIAQMKGYKCND